MSYQFGILDRVLALRKRRRWSQGEMAARLGLTEEAYRALEKGRTVRLEWDTMIHFINLLRESGLTWEWLLFGSPAREGKAESEPMHGASDFADIKSSLPEPPVIHRRRKRAALPPSVGEIPLYELAEAGKFVSIRTGKLKTSAARRLKVDPPIAGGGLGVIVRGQDFGSGFDEGDVVLLVPGRPDLGLPGLMVLRSHRCFAAVWQEERPGEYRVRPLDAGKPIRIVTEAEVLATFKMVRRVPGGGDQPKSTLQ